MNQRISSNTVIVSEQRIKDEKVYSSFFLPSTHSNLCVYKFRISRQLKKEEHPSKSLIKVSEV